MRPGSRYLSVLSRPGALLAFSSAVVARLPISMVTLGAVLLVESERGSYALAGGITACFALGSAVGTPWWGRQLDRHRQSIVLGPASVVSALLLVAFALGVVGGASTWQLVVLSALEGLTFPPLSPAMRSAWQALLAEEPERQAAYALEAVAIEVVFVAGPLLLSLLLITTPNAVPLIITAGLQAAGTLVYISSSASRRASAVVSARAARSAATGEPPIRGPWPLSTARVVIVLGIATALAAGFGNVDVSVAATARDTLGNEALLGLLYLGIAGGSAAGGLWYGSRTWTRTDWHRMPISLGALSAGLVVLAGFTTWIAATDSGAGLLLLLPLIALLFLAGSCIAPSLIMQQNLIDAMTAADRRSEAQSWLNASLTAGGAAGTAFAGVLVDIGGPPVGFAGAAGALAIGSAVAYAARPAESLVTGR